MQKTEAKKIALRYAERLRGAHYPFSAMYLFGSRAKNTANTHSDIDIAVISEKLKENSDKNRLLLWKLRRDIDLRIEPHGFTKKMFSEKANPLVHTILETGTKII